VMKTIVTNILNYNRNESGKKTVETARLLRETELQMGAEVFELKGGYNRFHSIIDEMQKEHKLVSVKVSGTNGRNPFLYNKYRIADVEKNSTEKNNIIVNDILAFHPRLKKDYYLKNIRQFENDRDYILKISNYLSSLDVSHALDYRCTLNERSFEIFNDEKLLADKGETVLKRLGLNFEDLNCYRTYEAFFYYFIKKSDINNVLIIENKDTFLSLLKACSSDGSDRRRNRNIHLLVYGEGNKIQNSFRFMEELEQNINMGSVYYFGDLDYAGIDIFQRLKANYAKYNIAPHTGLYRQLMDYVQTPPPARNAKTTEIEEFLKYFCMEDAGRLDKLLKEGKYIPQEGINFARGEFEL
jgi:hypothetical protein